MPIEIGTGIVIEGGISWGPDIPVNPIQNLITDAGDQLVTLSGDDLVTVV